MFLTINQEKMKLFTQDKIRQWREVEFKKNDIALQNALADNEEVFRQDAITQRNYLRDLPTICEGKTVEQLKEILITYSL